MTWPQRLMQIHHHLWVCPQFDIHHADLTAEGHLHFYARLKGVREGSCGEGLETGGVGGRVGRSFVWGPQ